MVATGLVTTTEGRVILNKGSKVGAKVGNKLMSNYLGIDINDIKDIFTEDVEEVKENV